MHRAGSGRPRWRWPPTVSAAPGPAQPRLSAPVRRRRRHAPASCRDPRAARRAIRTARMSIAALAALARHGATVEAHVLDRLLAEDAELTARALAAATSMTEPIDAGASAPSTTCCSAARATGCWPCSRCATARTGSPQHGARSPAPTARAARSASRCCSSRSRGPKPRSSTPSCATTSRRPSGSRRLRAATDVPERDRAGVARRPRARPGEPVALAVAAGRRAPRRAALRPAGRRSARTRTGHHRGTRDAGSPSARRARARRGQRGRGVPAD